MRLIEADAVYKILESCEIRKATIGNPLTDWEYGYTCGIERAESEIECAPTVDAIPVAFIESEKQRVNAMVVEEAKAGNIKEADRLSTIMVVMDAIISNWRYTTGNDWRAENETD